LPSSKQRRKKPESLEKQAEAFLVKITPTVGTVAAAISLINTIIEIAKVAKLPLEVEKVVPLQIVMPVEKVPP